VEEVGRRRHVAGASSRGVTKEPTERRLIDSAAGTVRLPQGMLRLSPVARRASSRSGDRERSSWIASQTDGGERGVEAKRTGWGDDGEVRAS